MRYDSMRMTETIAGVAIAVVSFDGAKCVGFYMVWPVPLTDGKSSSGGAGDRHYDTPGLPRAGHSVPAWPASATGSVLKAGSRFCMGRLTRLPIRAIWAASTGHIRGDPLIRAATHGRRADTWRWNTRSGCQSAPDFQSGLVRCAARNPLSEEIDRCLSVLPAKPRTWRVARSATWLLYRYQPAGKWDYRWLSFYRNHSLQGFAVIGVPDGGKGRMRLGALVEIVGPGEVQKAAAGCAVRLARECHLHGLVTQTTSRDQARALRANGFISVRRTPLITRTLSYDCFDANPFVLGAWELFGGDFDIH